MTDNLFVLGQPYLDYPNTGSPPKEPTHGHLIHPSPFQKFPKEIVSMILQYAMDGSPLSPEDQEKHNPMDTDHRDLILVDMTKDKRLNLKNFKRSQLNMFELSRDLKPMLSGRYFSKKFRFTSVWAMLSFFTKCSARYCDDLESSRQNAVWDHVSEFEIVDNGVLTTWEQTANTASAFRDEPEKYKRVVYANFRPRRLCDCPGHDGVRFRVCLAQKGRADWLVQAEKSGMVITRDMLTHRIDLIT